MGKIQMFIKKQIGQRSYQFAVEGDNFHEVIMESKKLSFFGVKHCGICNSDDLDLSAHVTKQKKLPYTTVRCNACKATLNFGQQMENKDVYYLRTRVQEDGKKVLDWTPFEKSGNEE